MSFFRDLAHHPRKLLIRRMLFQVHLWSGILLSAYVVVIALTGSILVFRTELTRAQLPSTLHAYDATRTAPIANVIERFQETHPGARLDNLITPSQALPSYLLSASQGKQQLRLLADPITAAIYTQPRTWLDWVYDLHVYLLLGTAHGMQVNGVGAAILLLLTVTGLALWWPGMKLWTRGLRVSFRHNWRRINFDAHSAIGFWTLLIVSWWAVSGVYFAWYRQVSAAVSKVSPICGMLAPSAPRQDPASAVRVALPVLLEAIHRAAPTGHLYSLSDPALTGQTVYALVDLRAPGDFAHRDILTLSTTDARVLTDWHYGQNHTLSDWFLWAMHPLHFGTIWGTAVKILWAVCGLALAALTLTGLMMYWNRYLRHRFER